MEISLPAFVKSFHGNRSVSLCGPPYIEYGDGHIPSPAIAQFMKFASGISTLELIEDVVDLRGVKRLGIGLGLNTCLRRIDFNEHELGATGASSIADGLKTNTSLRSLRLFLCELDSEAMRHLSEALKVNHTLRVLDLGDNPIGDEGAMHLGEALEFNHGLEKLDVSGFMISAENRIGPEGAAYLAKGLRSNATLKVLDVRAHPIGEQGVGYFSAALCVNRSLLRLKFENIDDCGKNVLRELLQRNQNSKTKRMKLM